MTLREILGLNEPERFKLVYDEIVAEKILLYEILKALKGKASGEDVLVRVPESDSMFLGPGKKYEKEFEVSRSLVYLAYDIPDGIYLVIYRDGNPYYWASGEIGALELRNGINFGTVRVEVVNSSSISQKWSCTMLFV